jgi:hypothetical protein
MVQKSRAPVIGKQIILRVILFLAVLVVGFYNGQPFVIFLTENLHFKEPVSQFFGAFEGFQTWMAALTLSYTLWLGIVFGSLGKRADYAVIGIFFIFALYLFYGQSSQMYFGLIQVALVGNAIGFGLKLLRKQMGLK